MSSNDDKYDIRYTRGAAFGAVGLLLMLLAVRCAESLLIYFGQFLKDNGIREQFVDAYKALLQPQSSDFDSVFISYSTRDQSFADFLSTSGA